ncbi:MAG: hypothetical protein GX442_24210 [Candidatus Riflebacteria bacterium]|nr:hypothetical protein [Candidatus Riflebacteria bacterium]
MKGTNKQKKFDIRTPEGRAAFLVRLQGIAEEADKDRRRKGPRRSVGGEIIWCLAGCLQRGEPIPDDLRAKFLAAVNRCNIYLHRFAEKPGGAFLTSWDDAFGAPYKGIHVERWLEELRFQNEANRHAARTPAKREEGRQRPAKPYGKARRDLPTTPEALAERESISIGRAKRILYQRKK